VYGSLLEFNETFVVYTTLGTDQEVISDSSDRYSEEEQSSLRKTLSFALLDNNNRDSVLASGKYNLWKSISAEYSDDGMKASGESMIRVRLTDPNASLEKKKKKSKAKCTTIFNFRRNSKKAALEAKKRV